jgi:hypothetical protein
LNYTKSKAAARGQQLVLLVLQEQVTQADMCSMSIIALHGTA